MSWRFNSLVNRRAIIDRRVVSEALAEIAEKHDRVEVRRDAAAALVKAAMLAGRAELQRRLLEHPSRGLEAAAGYAFLTDQMLRVIFDFTITALYPDTNRTASERMTLIAVGGYGRGEMAPFSDIDVMFLTPWKQTAWGEQVIETMLYLLWDLGLKVGHSTRSVDDMIRMAKSDLTIRTALLESRYVWGDQPLYDEASARFRKEVVAGTARAFIADKLAERDARHQRMGDSRYVVEPNLKEGKGGLRDLHTLFWIGKYAYQVQSVNELVDKGLLTAPELRQFLKAENFLWAVRCNLHDIAGRAEERLTFDVQRELAVRMRYAERGGMSAVERFMRHYFLVARQVGDLTGLFLAHLDESRAQVPAERPHGFVIARRARESAGAGDVEMLPTRENAPGFAIPLAEVADVLADAAPHRLPSVARRGERLIRRLQIRPRQLLRLKLRRRAGVIDFPKGRWRRLFAIRRDEESSLSCPRAFVVPAGQRLLEKLRHRQRMHIHFIDRAFLREVEHLVLRVGEMPRQSGEPSGQLVTRDDAHLARFINRIRRDEQLPRLAMNHPAGTRAAHALRPDLQRHIRQDGEELVIAASEVVGRVGRAPQLPRPRHAQPRGVPGLARRDAGGHQAPGGYGPQARAVLEALLAKYQDEGVVGGLDNVKMLEIPPFNSMGTPFQLIKQFGTKAGFEQAVHELQAALYQEVA